MDILAIKTFTIVAVMLGVTAFGSKLNKAFETRWEFWGLFIGSLALLFIIPGFAFPINLILTLIFAVLMGLMIGPAIKGMMISFVVRKRLEAQGYTKARLKEVSVEEQKELVATIQKELSEGNEHASLAQDWNNIMGLAIYSTAAITILAAVIVFFSGIDFSFLGTGLFIALLGLIVVGILNAFFFKSPLMRLVSAYVGAVVFSLYLLYDFNRLREAVGDTSWETAINIAISIYLDIINLFLDLLQILGDSN
ncbi:Bax inhibitor-1 family protein [Patescibacteria group bacterium]|nr:Bax inhibitor-1 family protein [Patescibacteria group bacterium]